MIDQDGRWEDRPVAGLRALRDVVPPPSLVPAVMARIGEPRKRTLLGWLLRPRRLELRFSLVGLASMAVLGGLVVVALVAAGRRSGGQAMRLTAAAPPTSLTAHANSAGTIMVRFVLEARGARQVTVAGDFNEWDPARTPLEGPDLAGNFVATVPVTPGEHEYMFVVDGRWVTDPAAAERRADGFGRENALLRL